ncbi:LuxR C-terminal-related transcriptional regulator [Mycolicibacterium sp. HK-90]|uniref:helix-turn-helix transcriptional regulator n=1 Tax=Mycolicibacterium sp. HK-90 TaxID=3056937 RepID=UPI002659E89D|nr:LuxR C-terminal-related transcriptional regulator [Mycolicibacterium sp. HK-90]WKG04784.1 LuxR C-terminal-related transcriptional regulator [Mycolicibacterium sp. HK-90]
MQPTGTSGMQPVPWFLATTPSSNPDMLHRRAILDRLDEDLVGKRAVLVAAPSGFGKTVAVSQWAAERHRGEPGSVAWLTLTDRVGDRTDVLRGVLTALLNTAREQADSSLDQSLSAVFDSTSYVEAVDALRAVEPPRNVTVVIDDFQLARSVWPDVGVVELVENGPQWLRFVLITTDPVGAAWARLRVHDKAVVIGTDELAFTHDDVHTLVGLTDTSLADEEIDRILTATGGWPAAVRLVLVGGDGAPAFADGVDLTDYINTAVLARMRPDLADFALKVTVCPRVDESLARALTNRPDSAELLGDCVAAGLFLERINARESAVYQWHSLFVKHCQEILRRRHPAEWKRLNRLAAVELAQRYPLEAVEHAIRADDRLGYDVVADHWLELLLQSRSAALDLACLRLCEAFGENPETLMIRSSCRAVAGDAVTASLLFERAAAMSQSVATSGRLEFIADLTQLLIADDREVMDAAAGRVEAALTNRDVVSPRIYACALFVLGWADSRTRRTPARGSALLEAAVHECTALGLPEVAHRARQNLAFALAHAGELDRAERALQLVVRADESTPELWLSHDGDGIDRFTAGWIQFWRGEMGSAKEHFIAADATAGIGYPDTARMFLAFTASTLRDADVLNIAEAAVARMPDADTHGVPWVSYKAASRARLAEARGDQQLALELATGVAGSEHLPMVSAVLSGMCRRLGEPELADRLAHQALEPQVPGNVAAYALHTLALLAWQDGRAEAAHQRMEQLVTVARPERVRYQFVDNPDSACKELLAAHLSYTSCPDFVEEALVAREYERTDTRVADLTPREREILAFLRTAMTMQEIADKMSISVNTLKTHQRSIYRKLGAANRRQAINRIDR